jgi:hypothetical protein
VRAGGVEPLYVRFEPSEDDPPVRFTDRSSARTGKARAGRSGGSWVSTRTSSSYSRRGAAERRDCLGTTALPGTGEEAVTVRRHPSGRGLIGDPTDSG